MIPALRDAKDDEALRGTPLTVYLVLLYDFLDPVEFRPVKQAALASQLKLSERAVRDAVKTLCDRGYLARGDDKPGESRMFRLVYKRMPVVPLES
jgi:predicted DNA-binding transcriptional regulator